MGITTASGTKQTWRLYVSPSRYLFVSPKSSFIHLHLLLVLLQRCWDPWGRCPKWRSLLTTFFGLNAQRDVETLTRIQNEVQEQTGGSATATDYPGYQNNLWEDVLEMTDP